MKRSEQPRLEGATANKPLLLRYALAAGCMIAAVAVRYFLTPWLGEELPFMLFIGAALVAAWYGGAAPGLAGLLIGLFLADHFFLSHNPPGKLEFFRVFRYLFTASLGIALIEVMRRNQRRLELEVAKRKASEAGLLEAHTALRRHASELDQRVTERTAQLAASVASLESLLYQIAHNFRAPLRAVRGYTEILAEEYAPHLDARAGQYCGRIAHAAERMDALIHDLLDYGRLGHLEVALSTISLEKVVDRVLFLAADQISAAQAEVQVLHPLPDLRANAETLEGVLSNLLDNALKFVPPDRRPRVRLRAETRGPIVRIWVEDNGIGIESRYHQKIFGVFERLCFQDSGEGTGIGLAVVTEGVKRMSGKVGLESEPGNGSRFWLELPAACPDQNGGPDAQRPCPRAVDAVSCREWPTTQAPVPVKVVVS